MPIMEQLAQVLDLIGATVQQGHDPASNFQSEHFEFSKSMISAFPNSPTAQKYKTAYEMFQKARKIIDQYKKAVVDTEIDCDFLQPAFHGYAEAYMCDNIWYDKFKPQENAPDLVDRYLILRPDDILSDFCKHIFVNKSQHSGSEFSKFKHLQLAIRNYELFAKKIQKAKTTLDIGCQILGTVYNRLGSLYTITKQAIRAIDSFQKAYEIDNDDHDSLYGFAWWLWNKDPKKAISLFHKYLDAAPKCHRKYYDAYYTLSLIYGAVYGNISNAKEYFGKGLEAENMQLPFIPPYETSSKQFAKMEIERLNKM